MYNSRPTSADNLPLPSSRNRSLPRLPSAIPSRRIPSRLLSSQPTPAASSLTKHEDNNYDNIHSAADNIDSTIPTATSNNTNNIHTQSYASNRTESSPMVSHFISSKASKSNAIPLSRNESYDQWDEIGVRDRGGDMKDEGGEVTDRNRDAAMKNNSNVSSGVLTGKVSSRPPSGCHTRNISSTNNINSRSYLNSSLRSTALIKDGGDYSQRGIISTVTATAAAAPMKTTTTITHQRTKSAVQLTSNNTTSRSRLSGGSSNSSNGGQHSEGHSDRSTPTRSPKASNFHKTVSRKTFTDVRTSPVNHPTVSDLLIGESGGIVAAIADYSNSTDLEDSGVLGSTSPDSTVDTVATNPTKGVEEGHHINVAIRFRPSQGSTRDGNSSSNLPSSRASPFVVKPSCATITDEQRKTTYSFDEVFDTRSTNTDIFNRSVKHIVDSCVQGFNGTIFAYGQTASGKTYTMRGNEFANEGDPDEGIIPKSVGEIFRLVEKCPSRQFRVSMSYLEVYNEKLIDLIAVLDTVAASPPPTLIAALTSTSSFCSTPSVISSSTTTTTSLTNSMASLGHRGTGGAWGSKTGGGWGPSNVTGGNSSQEPLVGVPGRPVYLTETKNGTELVNLAVRPVKSIAEVNRMLRDCEVFRHIGYTAMNDHSSRSHTILGIRIESKVAVTVKRSSVSKVDGDGEASEGGDDLGSGDEGQGWSSSGGWETGGTDFLPLRVGMLNLVDLAGSEGVSRARTEGMRKIEGSKINQSLLALTKVISQIIKRQVLIDKGEPDKLIKLYVNFRDSKLTRILSNSLGGNSKTAIVCCCSPDFEDYRESSSTLEFASRAKCIRNKAKVNLIVERSPDRKYEKLEAENQRLKLALAALANELNERTSQQAIESAVDGGEDGSDLFDGNATFENSDGEIENTSPPNLQTRPISEYANIEDDDLMTSPSKLSHCQVEGLADYAPDGKMFDRLSRHRGTSRRQSDRRGRRMTIDCLVEAYREVAWRQWDRQTADVLGTFPDAAALDSDQEDLRCSSSLKAGAVRTSPTLSLSSIMIASISRPLEDYYMEDCQQEGGQSVDSTDSHLLFLRDQGGDLVTAKCATEKMENKVEVDDSVSPRSRWVLLDRESGSGSYQYNKSKKGNKNSWSSMQSISEVVVDRRDEVSEGFQTSEDLLHRWASMEATRAILLPRPKCAVAVCGGVDRPSVAGSCIAVQTDTKLASELRLKLQRAIGLSLDSTVDHHLQERFERLTVESQRDRVALEEELRASLKEGRDYRERWKAMSLLNEQTVLKAKGLEKTLSETVAEHQAAMDNALAALEADLTRRFKGDAAAISEKLYNAEGQIAQFDSRYRDLQQQANAKLAAERNEKERLKKRVDALDSLEEESEHLKVTLDGAMSELREAREECAALKAMQELTLAEKDSLKSALKSMENDRDTRELSFAKMSSENSELRLRLDEALQGSAVAVACEVERTSKAEERCLTLQRDNEEKEQDLERSRCFITTLQSDKSELQEQLDDLNFELQGLGDVYTKICRKGAQYLIKVQDELVEAQGLLRASKEEIGRVTLIRARSELVLSEFIDRNAIQQQTTEELEELRWWSLRMIAVQAEADLLANSLLLVDREVELMSKNHQELMVSRSNVEAEMKLMDTRDEVEVCSRMEAELELEDLSSSCLALACQLARRYTEASTSIKCLTKSSAESTKALEMEWAERLMKKERELADGLMKAEQREQELQAQLMSYLVTSCRSTKQHACVGTSDDSDFGTELSVSESGGRNSQSPSKASFRKLQVDHDLLKREMKLLTKSLDDERLVWNCRMSEMELMKTERRKEIELLTEKLSNADATCSALKLRIIELKGDLDSKIMEVERLLKEKEKSTSSLTEQQIREAEALESINEKRKQRKEQRSHNGATMIGSKRMRSTESIFRKLPQTDESK